VTVEDQLVRKKRALAEGESSKHLAFNDSARVADCLAVPKLSRPPREAFAPPPRIRSDGAGDRLIDRASKSSAKEEKAPEGSRFRTRDFHSSGVAYWSGLSNPPRPKPGNKAPIDTKSPFRARDYSGVSAAQELGYHDTSKYWQR
jgi:hypothetical protein